MRLPITIIVVLLFSGCGDHDKEAGDIAIGYSDTLLAWETNSDSMTMKRDITLPDSVITIERIINGLNEKYPEVPLVFLSRRNDTVFTTVPNADYLGEQMGSAGATAWFDDAVINLTSVQGVNFVSIVMDPHSHAGSATIGRGKYKGWIRR